MTASNVEAIVLDIEGATTSIRFVYDGLFPFVREHVGRFLEQNWEEAQVQSDVNLIRAQAQSDLSSGATDAPQIPEGDQATPQDVSRNVHWQMDQDRKTTGLKSLQGKIWKDGYASGELKGHVYADVPKALQRWKDLGISVYIYSSGSVAAQKLLFGNSAAGDLMSLLSGYFDTTTGPKKEASSYTAIAASIGADPSRVVFITDNLDEAIAADAAGLRAFVSLRPGNHPVDEHSFPEISSFAELDRLIAK